MKIVGSFSIRAIALIFGIFLSSCTTSRLLPEPVDTGRVGFFDGHSGEDSDLRLRQAAEAEMLVDFDGQLKWPLKAPRVTSPFGKRGRRFHEGVDLKAARGTPVYAAGEGVVLYAGTKIRGYGKMIVVRHEDETSTIYAHNSRFFVKKGQKVKAGQKIALSGNTGRSHGPHLHFEIRKGLVALNPMKFLPPLHEETAQVATPKIVARASSQHHRRRKRQRSSGTDVGTPKWVPYVTQK